MGLRLHFREIQAGIRSAQAEDICTASIICSSWNQLRDKQILPVVCEISSETNGSEAGLPLLITCLLHKMEVKIKTSAPVWSCWPRWHFPTPSILRSKCDFILIQMALGSLMSLLMQCNSSSSQGQGVISFRLLLRCFMH